MAINFTVSYTFSPSTVISSSQVNTNFSDNASVWQGLEAVTKSFARLQVDAAPTVAADVVRKDYVDHYSAYRRPNLQFGSVTTVAVESGLDGTSGDIPLQFPDGQLRTETSTTRTTFDITRNAVLVTSGAQSGLTGATSEATNTWYALYGCKVTDSSTLWCTVGSTVLPIRANYATLNTAYGTNGWVYLGLIRNGDNSGATGDILNFVQTGGLTLFNNLATGTVLNANGIRLATSASTTTLTYTYSAGTGTTAIPNNIGNVVFTAFYAGGGSGANGVIRGTTGNAVYASGIGNANLGARVLVPAIYGCENNNSSALAMDIFLSGFVDVVLGVGSNPLL